MKNKELRQQTESFNINEQSPTSKRTFYADTVPGGGNDDDKNGNLFIWAPKFEEKSKSTLKSFCKQWNHKMFTREW